MSVRYLRKIVCRVVKVAFIGLCVTHSFCVEQVEKYMITFYSMKVYGRNDSSLVMIWDVTDQPFKRQRLKSQSIQERERDNSRFEKGKQAITHAIINHVLLSNK